MRAELSTSHSSRSCTYSAHVPADHLKVGIHSPPPRAMTLCRPLRLTCVMTCPLTSGFSSSSSFVHSLALDLPRLSASRKKLIPKSASVTVAESAIVKLPTPGRTRFLRVSVPATLDPEPSMSRSGIMRSTWLSSRARWPLAAHRRSCRSYFFSLAVGACKGGGVVVVVVDAMEINFQLRTASPSITVWPG